MDYDCPQCPPGHPLPCPCYMNCEFHGMAETQIHGLRIGLNIDTEYDHIFPEFYP